MKKLLLITAGAWMLWTASVKAQITYEHTYSIAQPGQYNLFLTNLGNNNFKHVIYDYYNAELNLYNLDHTPFMLNIPVPVQDSGAFYRIGYITSTLFDCDSTNIEYALMSNSPSPSRKFWVYRTDGTLIFSRDSVTTNYCYGCGAGSIEIHPIVNTPAGAKLYLFKAISGFWEISVYGLCDSLPVSFMDMNQSDSYLRVYPNPSSGMMNFKFTLPSSFERYKLTIYNSELREIKTMIIEGETELALDCRTLSPGAYFYSFQNKNRIFQSGQFVLTK